MTIWSVRSDFFCCSFSISTSNLWNAPIMKTFIFCVYQSSVSSATPTYIGHPERYSCRLLVWHMRKKSRWAREVGMCCWQKILSEKCREVIWLQVLTIYQILSMYFQGAHQNTFLWQTLLLQLSWGKIAVRRKISCKCFYQIDHSSGFSDWFKGNILVSFETYIQHSSRAVLTNTKLTFCITFERERKERFPKPQEKKMLCGLCYGYTKNI